MAPPPKTGPLTIADLQQLWLSVTDSGYTRPFVELGEGHGFEAYTQGFAQFARVSQAVDRSFGSLYVTLYSGQTSLPATGAALATVALTVTRARAFAQLLVLDPGRVFVEELQTDFGPGGGVPVLTGRRYSVTTPLVLFPGDAGPLQVHAAAEAPGYGYNNPLPGTLTAIDQPGSGFTNDRASVTPGITAHTLTVRPEPDVVIPEHVGQHVLFTAGANAGQLRRIVGYEEPTVNTNPPTGGAVLLAPTMALRIQLLAGAFLPGETAEQGSTGAAVRVLGQNASLVVADRLAGTIALGQIVFGTRSGAVAVFDAIEESPDMTAETGTASWAIQDYAIDFGIAVTNAASPSGGQSATLDQVGDERGVQRRAGEQGTQGDTSYRKRVGALADTVSPNAISRTANRILAPVGQSGVLREVGQPLLRGLFFDGDPLTADPDVAFACDFDMLICGSAFTTFLEGELVVQVQPSGEKATGRAVVDYAVPPGPLPQLLPTPTFAGISRVRGTFVNGVPITGTRSGATIASPVFTGGLSERDRYKVALDYTDFRGFFLMGVPKMGLGDFGIAFDVGASNAFDCAPYFGFMDGIALTDAILDRGIWNGLDAARAGGVGFDLSIERQGP